MQTPVFFPSQSSQSAERTSSPLEMEQPYEGFPPAVPTEQDIQDLEVYKLTPDVPGTPTHFWTASLIGLGINNSGK